mgnify:FL=1
MGRRIGIVGFGKLGQFLAKRITEQPDLELTFIWNRSHVKESLVPCGTTILTDLAETEQHQVDLIVEVAHPDITRKWGVSFLEQADYMIGSPTALCDEQVYEDLQDKAHRGPQALYIPQGAMIGLGDLLLAKDRGRVTKLAITMEKTPDSIKYYGPLKKPLDQVISRETIYTGPVGPLCKYAPNNVNTMAVATLASGLKFSDVEAKLIVDPELSCHVVRLEVTGPETAEGRFRLYFQKENPAAPGAVTGQATYDSFFNSILQATANTPGIHFC